jgi:hypothetical protein
VLAGVDCKSRLHGIITGMESARQLSYLECPEVTRLRRLEQFHQGILASRVPDSSLLVLNGCQTQTIDRNKIQESINARINRARARFMVRAYKGVASGVQKGCTFRWFTLTESDEALARGLKFGKEWNSCRTWLRKVHSPSFESIIVEHKQGKPSKVTGLQRSNFHVITYGNEKLPVHELREYWQKHYSSTLTGLQRIVDMPKTIKYVAGYVSSSEKFVRSWHSQGWIFPGWVGQSKLYKREYGEYYSDDVLRALSVMDKSSRGYELECLLNTGYLSEVAFSLK